MELQLGDIVELYRFGGDFKKLKVGYALETITANRLDVGLVDWHAIDKLVSLISGGISSLDDLYAAETALRAIVFHDKIQEIRPSIKVQIINPGFANFIYNDSPNPQNRLPLQDSLTSSNHSVMLCGIDHLLGFGPQVDVKEYLSKREESIARKLLEEEEQRKAAGLPQPTFRLDMTIAPIEPVASGKEQFFSDIFLSSEDYINKFLAPLSTSGYAVYLGHPNTRIYYEKMRNYNAGEFFDVLDEHWAKHNHKLRRILDIPIPLFLSIILSRSSSRDSIAAEILFLKEEFSEARSQLWDLFDEADFRIYDTEIASRVLSDIEREAEAVIPHALKAHEFWFPLQFDWLGRAVEFEQLGLLKNAGNFIKTALPNQCIRLDAANITQKSLQSLELRGLLERFLSEQELAKIDANRR
ncbi:hypothetical protein J6I90_09345 [Pseudidiomarina sp. 1APP75-32.1]|uniref:Uncharacterized protein n=1 Tax=Pseudidiomarina terrestris TaxID=2820060 RepID=A0AAW7QYY5_9GAMM|nr:hypothetical protein [Pseudidiomarina sp. 1APP75-32.1]MDN7125083.1 hypothetical protein [Pseudidiomarina sp. 1APP75-32.1]